MTRILKLGLLFLIGSCSNIENDNNNSFYKTTQPRYSYQTYISGFTREAFIKELDTSKWILNSYWVTPSKKSVINLDSTDSLFHFVVSNPELNTYVFQTSSDLIFKNGSKIGTIKKEKTDFETLTNPNGEKSGIRYHTIFYISQPQDSIMNGLFNISYSREERLHLSQLRINNKSNKREVVRLIFYKKKITPNTK